MTGWISSLQLAEKLVKGACLVKLVDSVGQ